MPPPLTPPCFTAGTRILTTQGEKPVEQLSVGNLVIWPSGSSSKITWLGSMEIDLKTSPDRQHLSPIKIERNALKDGVPHRDLYLSADHCLFIDGVLIPVRLLVNDMSIVRANNFDFVAYWHVELERHGIVLAEGAAAETFLPWGDNRSPFTRTSGEPGKGKSPLAAPIVMGGDVVDAVHRRLQLRAEASVFGKAQNPMGSKPFPAGIVYRNPS